MTAPRVALIGDSQAEALWPRVQKAMPDVDFVLSRFQRGWSEWSYKNDGTIAQQLIDARPDLVVIELGGNNSFLTDVKYRPNVDWMLNAAKASGAKHVLWFGPAAATKEPFKANKEWTRAYQSQYLPSQGVTWYDNFPHTLSGHADGVHFKPSVYNTWAPALVEQIRGAISSLDASPSLPALPPSQGRPLFLAGIGVLVGGILLAFTLKRLAD
jgi:lysophospholipase L1-like esterase